MLIHLLKSKLFIQATNIHQGGGRLLLEALLLAAKSEVVLSVDERLALPENFDCRDNVRRIRPTIFKRLRAEMWLADNVSNDDVVLCFGNLPPLFKLRGRVMVFLQNRYLIEDIPLNRFSFRVRARLSLERLWLRWKLKNVDQFIVQTLTMKRLLELNIKGKVPVRVLPFVAEPSGYARTLTQSTERKEGGFDFVYVASGEPHKNHILLIDAWCLLAKEGYFPSLCLTLDEVHFPQLCSLIKDVQQRHNLKLWNLGTLDHKSALDLYKKCGAAIYPSKFESFGLPLIEARQAGLPVLAAELDFVRDVLDPEQVFDPDSPLSIARAVKRFMGIIEYSLPLLDASQFLDEIYKKDS